MTPVEALIRCTVHLIIPSTARNWDLSKNVAGYVVKSENIFPQGQAFNYQRVLIRKAMISRSRRQKYPDVAVRVADK